MLFCPWTTTGTWTWMESSRRSGGNMRGFLTGAQLKWMPCTGAGWVDIRETGTQISSSEKKPKMCCVSSLQYQDLQNMWANQQEQLRNSHQEIQELARQIQRLQPEIEIARKRVRLIPSSRTKWFKPLFNGISVQYGAASHLEANLGMKFSLPNEADLDFGDVYWGLIVLIYPV